MSDGTLDIPPWRWNLSNEQMFRVMRNAKQLGITEYDYVRNAISDALDKDRRLNDSSTHGDHKFQASFSCEELALVKDAAARRGISVEKLMTTAILHYVSPATAAEAKDENNG
jgi:hypothetical protein